MENQPTRGIEHILFLVDYIWTNLTKFLKENYYDLMLVAIDPLRFSFLIPAAIIIKIK